MASTTEIAVVGGIGIAAVVLLARQGRGSSSAPYSAAGTMGTLNRPLPAGWYSNTSQSAAVGSIEQAQLRSIGYTCSDETTCGQALQQFASASGLADPFGADQQNEAYATALANALDNKYRIVNGLSLPSSSIVGRIRERY